jgi:Rieske Fe-S protein
MGLVGGGLLLESCATSLPLIKATPKEQSLFIPLTKFSDKSNMLVVRSSSLENDILLIKNENVYKALYLKCTHEGIGLTATAKNIVCPAHGSTFDFKGNVLKEPALRPLREFKTETAGDTIVIHLI